MNTLTTEKSASSLGKPLRTILELDQSHGAAEKMNELDAQRDAWFQKGGGMTYEEWRRGVPSLAVKIRAKGLDNKDGPLSASDPYFKISHIPSHFKDYRKCSRPIEVFRSKTIKNNLAPNWKTVSMNLHDLYRTHGVNVDPDRLLVFSVWDLDVGVTTLLESVSQASEISLTLSR